MLEIVQSFVVRSVDGNSSETPASLSYTAEVSKPFVEKTSKKPYSSVDETATIKEIITETVEEHVDTAQPKRAAKIHDFCFGIPYGILSHSLSKLSFNRIAELPVEVIRGHFVRWPRYEWRVAWICVFTEPYKFK